MLIGPKADWSIAFLLLSTSHTLQLMGTSRIHHLLLAYTLWAQKVWMCHLTLLYSCPLCLRTTFANTPQRGGLSAKHFHKGTQRQWDARRTDERLCTLCLRSSRVSMSDTVWPVQQCVGEEVNQAWVRHIPLPVRVMSEPLAVSAKRVDENSEVLSGKTEDRQTGAWSRSNNADESYCYGGRCQGLYHPKSRKREQKCVFTLNDAMFFVSFKFRCISLIWIKCFKYCGSQIFSLFVFHPHLGSANWQLAAVSVFHMHLWQSLVQKLKLSCTKLDPCNPEANHRDEEWLMGNTPRW